MCNEKTSDAVLNDVRTAFIGMLERMREVDAVIHPWIIEDVWRMAELLKVDTATIPTESNSLSG